MEFCHDRPRASSVRRAPGPGSAGGGGLVMARPQTVVAVVCAAAAVAAMKSGADAAPPQPTAAVGDIPGRYLTLYRQHANTCPGLDWALLAGVGKVETNHGRSNLAGVQSGSNSAGAKGPMQFLGSTFHSVRAKHADVGSDPYDPADAIPAAAHYLCDSGLTNGDEYAAILAYNHADWYVAQVRTQAADYRAA